MILLNFATKITGSSKVDKHDGWIPISSIQMGVGRAVTVAAEGQLRNTSNPSFSEVTLTKPTDMASADLFIQAAGGISLGTAELHFIQSGGQGTDVQVYMTLELGEAIITSYSASSNGEHPSDTFSINYTTISFKHNSFDGKTVLTGTEKKWNVIGKKRM